MSRPRRQPKPKAAPDVGGKGDAPSTALAAPSVPLIEPAHERAGLALIARAIRGGWKVPAHVLDTVPRMVADIAASSESERERLRAAEVLIAMERANTDALSIADKCERLDGGGATERMELAPITLRPGGGGSA